jgi:AAA+ superfamily predicted ATPase
LYGPNYKGNAIYQLVGSYQNINDNNIYGLFFQGTISDFNNPQYKNHETFDNLFHQHKKSLIRDIDRLRDIEYYKRTGLKQKKGYLFYGPPGCGKTSTVMAMSNYDKRHIIEIPLSRVKTNNDFEKILNLSKIDDLKFNFNNIIILFDELDIGTSFERNIKNNNDIKLTTELSDNDIPKINSDKLCLNTLLSRLDGIGNYNGLIIIGTSNNIENIDKALYREGRLNLMHFDYALCDDIINIIEKYYDDKLNDKQIEIVKNINNLSHSKLICKLEEYDDIDKLLLSL